MEQKIKTKEEILIDKVKKVLGYIPAWNQTITKEMVEDIELFISKEFKND
jgi:hypothetical protein